MAEAAEQFGAYLQDVKFSSTFRSPLLNYTGYPYDRDCRELLQQQICNPVRWQTLVENMIADGADTFIELGPGQVLGGLIGHRQVRDHLSRGGLRQPGKDSERGKPMINGKTAIVTGGSRGIVGPSL